MRAFWVGLALLGFGCGDDGRGNDTEIGSSTGVAGTTGSSGVTTTSTTGSTGSSSTAADGSSGDTGSSSGGESSSSSSTGGPIGSAGCGNPASDPAEEFVPKTINVGGVDREYFVWLPANYDPMRPYPVVYQHHGCNGNPNNVPPVQNHSGDTAIHVRGLGSADGCWDSTPDGADLPYFDAVVAEMDATYCTDAERRFAAGYSSGAFMTHRLACSRGDMLRGVASIAGATNPSDCVGEVAALLIHDEDDGTVNISTSENARDYYLTANGCDAPPTSTAWDEEPCVLYDGCDEALPLVWCQTSGSGHGRQDALSSLAFWTFFESL